MSADPMTKESRTPLRLVAVMPAVLRSMLHGRLKYLACLACASACSRFQCQVA